MARTQIRPWATRQQVDGHSVTERWAQCCNPRCRASETLYFDQGVLETGIKWRKSGCTVYHYCGNGLWFPARLMASLCWRKP